MNTLKKQIIREHVIILAVICSFVALSEMFGLRCPIYMLFHIPCPTCGVTRAMVSLVKLDFAAYMKYNPMALPMCAAVLGMIEVRCFRRKLPVYIFSIGTAVLNLIYWAVRLHIGDHSAVM